MAKKNNKMNQWPQTLLRLILGIIFTYHGYAKLFVIGALPATANFFADVGIPMANLMAVIVAFVEFIGGILLLIGILTRWSSILLLITMLGALLFAHLKNGFGLATGGYEYVLLIIGGLLAIISNGPGNFAWGKSFKNKKLQ